MDLLVPGLTCWKVAPATRLSLIQDAGPTFAHVADAFESARRSIFILGWDLDSRTVLRPDATDPDDRVLLPLLLRCLRRHATLEIFILTWDFSLVYAFEREPAARRQFANVHPRLHFSLDSDHGSGGSHHQKIVVIDDQLAFTGGIDLTFHRWDTPAHALFDSHRLDAEGRPYGPFHDVHAAVAGPAAAALGELARSRWSAGGRTPAPAPEPPAGPLPWPPGLAVDANDIDVGLARTLTQRGAQGGGETSIREIEALTVKAIGAAQRHIYAENQYLTSRTITRALARRLEAPDGPEVVIVLPQHDSGWMEQSSMGLLREKALGYLEDSNRHGRLRLLSPVACQGDQSAPVAVHSKVLVVDDKLAKIGSSNFSNRSMGLDSECDLAVEGTDAAGKAFVVSVRNRLIAEHLGVSPELVGARFDQVGSLRGVLEGPWSPTAPRKLIPVATTCEAPVDLTLFDGAMVDPPEPWNTDMLLKRAFPRPLRRRLERRWMWPLVFTAIVLGGWALLQHLDPQGTQLRAMFKNAAHWIAEQPGGAFAAVLAIALAGMVFMPFTILATTAITVFGLWPGVPVAWAGAVLSAVGSHALGRALGPRAVAWLPDRPLAGLRRFLGRRGFWAVVVIRLLPVGNFGVLNLLTGAIGVPRRAFILGNMVGLLPGLLGLGLFVDRAIEALRHPTLANVLIALAIIILGTILGAVLKRRIERATTRAGTPR